MSPGTFTKRETANLVVQDIECWWSKTGIKLKTSGGIQHMIMAIVDQYCALKKNKARENKREKENRDIFLNDLK